MVEETNSFTAWTSGVGHEIDGLINGQPLDEMFMDLHNNAIGREAGLTGKSVNPAGLVILPNNGSKYDPYGFYGSSCR